MTRFDAHLRVLAAAALLAAALGAQSPPPTAFEVASIRQHTGPLHTMDTTSISGTLVRYQGYTVGALVREAYHLNRYQLSLAGSPDWAERTFYEIEARAPGTGAVTRDQARLMLQTLLVQRFHLAVRQETKTMPVYALTVGKKGSRIVPDLAANKCSRRVSVAPGGQSYAFSGCGIGELAQMLEDQIVDRPVVDRTGLAGIYDYTLFCSPLQRLRQQPEAGGLSPFAALEQQLGLKLTASKAPLPVVAVAHVEAPTPN